MLGYIDCLNWTLGSKGQNRGTGLCNQFEGLNIKKDYTFFRLTEGLEGAPPAPACMGRLTVGLCHAS